MAGPLKKPFVASSPAARIVDDATDNRDRSDLWKGGFDVLKARREARANNIVGCFRSTGLASVPLRFFPL